ncbi:MAG: hypothetical protein KatS3mg099_343 [Candidatus Parcubacteria bacterium]|nr:MAG: hypothetical protein KatS3mg099_343 [Candidatus Parcubacteria bacterium]
MATHPASHTPSSSAGSPPPLPQEFAELRNELYFGIEGLLETFGLDALPEETRRETLENLAEWVYTEALGKLLVEGDDATADAFLRAAHEAREANDEMMFVRALADHYPHFPEVFAQTAVEVLERAQALTEEWIASSEMSWLFDPALDDAVARHSAPLQAPPSSQRPEFPEE